MMATKAALRAEYRAKRRALSEADVAWYSEQICQQFKESMNAGGDRDDIFTKDVISISARIHTFLPIQSQNEVDTWPIIRWLWQQHPTITVVTSVADFTTHTLSHFALTPETTLLTNHYGIPEPDPATSRPVPTSAIDLVLVPLLAVDRRGHRVGYGKGFYDLFLAQCSPDCLKIGLSLFELVEQISDVSETDVLLNSCITPTRVYPLGR